MLQPLDAFRFGLYTLCISVSCLHIACRQGRMQRGIPTRSLTSLARASASCQRSEGPCLEHTFVPHLSDSGSSEVSSKRQSATTTSGCAEASGGGLADSGQLRGFPAVESARSKSFRAEPRQKQSQRLFRRIRQHQLRQLKRGFLQLQGVRSKQS